MMLKRSVTFLETGAGDENQIDLDDQTNTMYCELVHVINQLTERADGVEVTWDEEFTVVNIKRL